MGISHDYSRNAVAVRFSYDQLGMVDSRYARKVKTRTETPPKPEEWAEYRRACLLLEALRSFACFYEGGPEEGAGVERPESTYVTEYAETEAEWLARCRTLSSHTGESFFRKARP